MKHPLNSFQIKRTGLSGFAGPGLSLVLSVGLVLACLGCAGPGRDRERNPHSVPGQTPGPITPEPTHDRAAPIDPEPLGQNLQPPHVGPEDSITLSDLKRWEGRTTQFAPADGTVTHWPIYVRSAGQVVDHHPPTEAHWVRDRMLAALDDARAENYSLGNTARLLVEPPWAYVQLVTIPPRMVLTFPWLERTSP